MRQHQELLVLTAIGFVGMTAVLVLYAALSLALDAIGLGGLTTIPQTIC